MLSTTRSLLNAQSEAARRVAAGRRFSVRLPVLGTVQVPGPDQLAFYGVLAGLAALELIDWPVAVAMGVGSVVISRHLSDLEAREAALEARESELERAVRATPAPRQNPPQKAPAKKAPAKKAPAKKAPAKKIPAQRSPAKKAAAKKTGAKAQKAAARKSSGPKPAIRKAGGQTG